MSLFKLTVEGTTPEELLSNLLAAVNSMSAGAGLSLSASGASVGEKEPTKEQIATETSQQPEATVPSGRRGSRKGADKEVDKDTGAGRRTRGAAKKDDLVADNEEQAALRAQLITDLQDLADVEEAHGEVQEALQRVGSKNIKEIPSDLLGDFNEAIQKLIGKYFE